MSFRHKEANKVAHCVVALALKGVGRHVWVRDVPIIVWDLISLDVINCFVSSFLFDNESFLLVIEKKNKKERKINIFIKCYVRIQRL